MNAVPHVHPVLELSSSLAIVGSSAKLLEDERGAEIDSFDDVMRFNRAPTKGFEEIAGSKTTIRIVNGHVFMSEPFTRWEEDDDFVKRLRDTRLLLARDPDLVAKRREAVDDSIELFFVEHTFDSFLRRNNYPELPTVGLTGILLAVLAGIKPVVYGWSTTVQEPMSHYFNQRSPTTSDCHKWDREIQELQKLMDDDQIEVR